MSVHLTARVRPAVCRPRRLFEAVEPVQYGVGGQAVDAVEDLVPQVGEQPDAGAAPVVHLGGGDQLGAGFPGALGPVPSGRVRQSNCQELRMG